MSAVIASLLLMLATAGGPLKAQAQTWSTETGLRLVAAARTNGGLAPSGDERKDLVMAVTPTFVIDAEDRRFELPGLAGADLVDHTCGSQPKRIAPKVGIDSAAAFVETVNGLSLNLLRAERRPAPWGGSIGFVSQRQHYPADAAEEWNLDTLLLKGDGSSDPELVVDAFVGLHHRF